MTSIFEPIFVPSKLEDDARDHISAWIETYLREVTRQTLGPAAVGKIPTPASISSRNDFVKFPEDNLPAIVIINAGVVDEPVPDGEGIYGAWWAMGVGVLASASTEDATRLVTQIYGAALRALLVQKPNMNNGGYQVEWVDETYDDMPIEDQTRTLRSVRLVFRVWVDEVVTRWSGPAAPDPPDPVTMPGSQWPTADEVVVETNIVGHDEEVS